MSIPALDERTDELVSQLKPPEKTPIFNRLQLYLFEPRESMSVFRKAFYQILVLLD